MKKEMNYKKLGINGNVEFITAEHLKEYEAVFYNVRDYIEAKKYDLASNACSAEIERIENRRVKNDQLDLLMYSHFVNIYNIIQDEYYGILVQAIDKAKDSLIHIKSINLMLGDALKKALSSAF